MREKYNKLAKKSFKAKWNVYLLDKIIQGKELGIREDDFKKFILTDEKVQQFSNEYWQKEAEEKIGDLKIAEIDATINKFEYGERIYIEEYEKNYIEETFPVLMSMVDFEKLLTSKQCYHCKTSIDEIHEWRKKGKLRKKNGKGWTLEIDRLKPNFEYTSNNCVVSCYWCNNAKTDEFSAEEFKSIGQEIRKIFKHR